MVYPFTAKTIFLLSCDLFSDFKAHQLVDLHRIHGSSVTTLFAKNSLDMKKVVIPGPKVKVKKERDFIGIDMLKAGTNSGQLCLWNSEADLGKEYSITWMSTSILNTIFVNFGSIL